MMKAQTFLAFVCTSLTAACGGTVTGSPAEDGLVTGTVVNRYFLESGQSIERPMDLSTTPVRALVWSGARWTTYPGTGGPDGSFTVSGVPPGPFVLGVGSSYVQTKARTLDFGTEIAGRADATPAAVSDQPDVINGSLQNLAPGDPGDLVVLADINANGWGFAGPPPTGATSFTFETSSWRGALVDGSNGDILHAYQTRTTGPHEQSVIIRHAAVSGIEQHHGTTQVSATLADVPLSESLTLEFRGSEFAAQAPAISPNYGTPEVYLSLMTAPGASEVPAILNATSSQFLGAAPCLLCLSLSAPADVTLNSVAYGNPFPAAWGTTVTAYEWAIPSYPPGSQNWWAPGAVAVTMPLAEALASPIRPGVSPVRDLRIAGQDAFGTVVGTGLFPQISWNPPALGAPSAYKVRVWSAQPCAHRTAWGCTPDATVVTTETSIVMPPGVLTAGAQYQVVVTAEVSPVDVAMKPFRFGPRLASADAVSNLALP